MNTIELDPRFRVLHWLHEGPTARLAQVRDASSGAVQWGVWIESARGPGVRLMIGVVQDMARHFDLGLVSRHAAVDALEVIETERGILALLDPIDGEPWVGRWSTMDEENRAASVDALRSLASQWIESGLGCGPLDVGAVWWTATGPQLLPSCWLCGPAASPTRSLEPMCDPVRALAVWHDWEAAVARWCAERGIEAPRFGLAETIAAGATASQESQAVVAVERAANEGRWVRMRTASLDQTAETLERAGHARGHVVHRLSPFSRPESSRRESAGKGSWVVLEGDGPWAGFDDSLRRLEKDGWIDGEETLVVLRRSDATSAHAESTPTREGALGVQASRTPLDLYTSIRYGRDRELRVELDDAADAEFLRLRQESVTSGPILRVLEALAALDRPCTGALLERITAVEPDALSRALGEGHRTGAITLGIGRHAESGHRQLVVRASARARIDAGRARELARLALTGLESRGRIGLGLRWLRADACDRAERRDAQRRWRELAEQAQEQGLNLLAVEAYDRLRNAAGAMESVALLAQSAIARSDPLQRAGDVEQAQEILRDALERVRDGGQEVDPDLEAELVLRLVQLELHRSDFAAAEQRLSGLLARSKDRLGAQSRARVYLELAWALLQLGRTRESVRAGELALQILDPLRHGALVARGHNQIGFALYKESDYIGSIVHYERALKLREQLGDRLGVARTHNNLALSHRALGQLDEAERSLMESLRLKRAAGDELSAAASLLNLGFVQIDLGRVDRAEESAIHCLEIARKHQHPETEAEAWGLRGEAALAQGEASRALEYLERDLEICESTEHQSERLVTLRRMAEVLLRLDRIDAARERVASARALLRAQPSRYETAMIDCIEADLALADGEQASAVEHFGAAARGFAAVGQAKAEVSALARRGLGQLDLGQESRARLTLAEIEERLGRHEIHSDDAAVVELETRLRTREGAHEPLGPEVCLDVMVQALAGVGPSLLQSARVVESVATALGAEEVLWIRENESLRPSDEEWEPAPPPAEWGPSTAGSVGTIERIGDWACLFVPAAAGGGSLLLRRPQPLRDYEEQLLRGLATLWSRPVVDGGEASSKEEWAHETEKTRERSQHGLIGHSDSIRDVVQRTNRVAATDVSVLILGENGTGKELVARAIHRASARAKGPFVAVNCASIPASLLESELFGHERGAFTSAHARRLGRFELADRGTIFLDEIGEMPLEMQAKILRVLQERSFQRVGGTETVRADVRVLAATNRELEREVERGRFRMDLYYRLDVVSIELPPLRERPDDVEILALHFLTKHGPDYGARVTAISPEAMRCLQSYAWPGNVRELENALKHALVFATGETLRMEDLPAVVVGAAPSHDRRALEDAVASIVASEDFSEERPLQRRVELLLAHAMVSRVGNKTKAARLLGITKPTLYDRLKRYELLYGDDED